MSQDRYHIGIDVGGTFTDIVVCDRTDGALTLHKVPTTPHDIASGISAALKKSGAPAAEIAEIAHGTTVATNALLERKGARTALLTTAGFRDLLELRDGGRRPLRGLAAGLRADNPPPPALGGLGKHGPLRDGHSGSGRA